MNMAGLGKGFSTPKDKPIDPKEVIQPATDAMQKAATAGKLKSIKLKVKFKKPNGNGS